MSHSTFMLPEKELDTVVSRCNLENGHAVNVGKNASFKLGSEYASGGAGCIYSVEDYINFFGGASHT